MPYPSDFHGPFHDYDRNFLLCATASMIAHSRRYRFARAVCLAIVALSSLLVLRTLIAQRSWLSLRIFENPPAQTRGNALVVASLIDDDVSWLHAILPEWEKNIYVANNANAALTVPENKGRESMVYLRWAKVLVWKRS